MQIYKIIFFLTFFIIFFVHIFVNKFNYYKYMIYFPLIIFLINNFFWKVIINNFFATTSVKLCKFIKLFFFIAHFHRILAQFIFTKFNYCKAKVLLTLKILFIIFFCTVIINNCNNFFFSYTVFIIFLYIFSIEFNYYKATIHLPIIILIIIIFCTVIINNCSAILPVKVRKLFFCCCCWEFPSYCSRYFKK